MAAKTLCKCLWCKRWLYVLTKRIKFGRGKIDDSHPVDKKKYDWNYLRLFRVPCPDCKGSGVLPTTLGIRTRYECLRCGGWGHVEKSKKYDGENF